MINVSFFSGAKSQVVHLITNHYFQQWTMVLCPEDQAGCSDRNSRASKDTGCLVTRDLEMKGNTIVSIPPGTLDNRIIGKTREAEVTIPVDLAHGLINYSMRKE
jgi:hypothetical protein